MQGLKTERAVLAALDVLENLNLDLVIIARGGGSKTDLFYLHNEAIARRIAEYKYPVWTGIGHETDTSIMDHVANRYFKTPTAVAEDIVARFVGMKRHLEESENRFRSTWAYRYDRDRKWLDEALTVIIQGTRKLLDSTKSFLLGYATTLSSRVQNRLTNEKSRIAVSRSLITTAPISLVKRANERLNERVGRFISGYKRQISERQKDLLNLKRRFQPDRFVRRIQHEHECVCDWRNRFLQRFRTGIQIYKQQVSQLSRRFRLETIINQIGNEKTKLAIKGANLRAADPVTSLKRGFSLVYADGGELVKSLSQIQVADTLKTEVNDGRIVSTINKTERK